MNKSSQRSLVHPSWILLTFCIGIIVGSIIVPMLKVKFFAHGIWILGAIISVIIAITVSLFTTTVLGKTWAVCLAFFSGIIMISARAGPEFLTQDYYADLVGKTVKLSGRVVKDPTDSLTSAGKINLDLSDNEINGRMLPGHLFVQLEKAEVQRSDIILVNGVISEKFGTYYATMFRPELCEIIHPEPGDIFLQIRNNFADQIKQYIPMPEAGLGIGYLLGQKSGVDQNIQDALRMVGLTHIIVASGAHLSTLIGFSRKIFGKISRFMSFLMALLLMLLFLGITGLSASMLRASIVTGLSLILWYVGRNIHPARLIILVVALTLIYNPFYLTDLAWLLSFASFTGIMILAPLIKNYFYGKDKKPGLFGSTLISSIAASLTCTPILLYFFGQVSVISMIANILILPTVSLAMGITFLTGLAGYFAPFVAQICGYITTLTLRYQISVANFFADNKSFLIEIDKENPWIYCLYIPVIVVFFTTIIRRKRRISLCLQE